jgi:diguanylate cyclase (GGDEF)-like protein
MTEKWQDVLLDNIADVLVLLLDEGGVIRYANMAARTTFGVERTNGARFVDLIHPNDRPTAMVSLLAARTGPPGESAGDWRLIDADGRERRMRASSMVLYDHPTIGEQIVTLHDVTRERQLEFGLARQALWDPLTRLPNRAAFHDQLWRASTYSTGASALLLVGLDVFREVNATMGHEIGDQVLVAMARRLQDAVGERGYVARLGGDEFAVLIDELSDQSEMRSLAENLLAEIRRPVTVAAGSYRGTASIGATSTVDAADEQDLLRQADLALHEAKRSGRNRWTRYQPALRKTMRERTNTRAELAAARTDEFELWFQPIISLDSGVVAGFEALLRWRHPRRNLLSPAEFIEIAEESGLIRPIGRWVLEQSIAAASRWQRLASHPVKVSVNVSVHQLRSPHFANTVLNLLREHELPPERLVLEVTESVQLPADDPAWADLERLRRCGSSVAIDDFGTGYSSLASLQNAPIDIVKIDKSFTDGVVASRPQRTFARHVIRLAQSVGLAVVVEGVEREEQAVELRAMNCDFGQGFHFGRPMERTDAERFLAMREAAAARPLFAIA